MAVAITEAIRIESRSLSYRAPLTVFFVNAALLSLWSAGLMPRIEVENGILETLQLLFAAGAFGIFMFAALEDDGPVGTAATATAAIAAIAVVREIDVRTLVVPDWMMLWSYSPFRDTTVAILSALVLVYAIVWREHLGGWLGLLFRWAALPYWLAGILLAGGIVFDGEKVIAGQAGVMVEEFSEMNGFMLLMIAGWRHCQLLTRGRRDAE